jgi:excisionase family DNA binding protein
MATLLVDAAKKLLTPEQAAEMLNIKTQTLSAWRCANRHGLPYVRVGACIRYQLADLEAWLASRTVGGVEEK